MSKVITFSKTFPKGHAKEGQPTFFVEKIFAGLADTQDNWEMPIGSGSSRIAAYKGGFNFVGFEIDAEYYEKQEKRFNDFKSQLRLF